ncbi:MAG TPA: hypothetical protein VFF81_06840 [Noviherbaspirillum sp.]|nr:hypothetical protein [Noviherbaspirillum sp.]
MEYGLTRLVFGSSKFVLISEQEYANLRSGRDVLLESLFIEEKFDLVVDNYLEFETYLLDLTAREMVRGVQTWTAFQGERGQVNRRIVNLLSSCRLYLDHTQHHLNNLGTAGKEAATIIKPFISAQYDSSLGYRAMEALRNYVQHRGYPIHGVTYSANWINDREKLLYGVTPYIMPAQLKEDGKFKASVLEELGSLGDRIDIKSLMREYIEGLAKIHNEARSQLQPVIEKSDKIIRDAINRYKSVEPVEDSVIALAAVRRDANTNVETCYLFEEQLDYRVQLVRKNRNLSNLVKRYVSSEVIP